MRSIGYARISSREQADNSHALEQQIERLKAAGATEVFSDVDSGSKDRRTSFAELMELVRSRAVDEVVVTRLDRLTRSLPTLRKALDVFRAKSVNLRALDDSIDLATAAGKFHLNMLGALAEMEVDRLSERIKHGWKHLRDRKVAMNPPFGYCKVDERHHLDHAQFLCLLEDKSTKTKAMIAREIVEAFLSNKSLRLTLRAINTKYGIHAFRNKPRGRTARDLFRFSPSGLKDWLTNPVLQGHLCYLRVRDGKRLNPADWEIHYNTHPDQRLISDRDATEIQEILSHNGRVRGYGSTALKYPLSGLVFCGECRAACYSATGSVNASRTPGLRNYYFQCKNWRTRSCGQKQMIRMSVVEHAVVEALCTKVQELATLAETPDEIEEPVKLKELRTQLEGLRSLGPNPAIDQAKIEIEGQIAKLNESLKRQSSQISVIRKQLEWAFSEPEYFLTLNDEQKRQLYRTLVSRVVVKDGEVSQVELRI